MIPITAVSFSLQQVGDHCVAGRTEVGNANCERKVVHDNGLFTQTRARRVGSRLRVFYNRRRARRWRYSAPSASNGWRPAFDASTEGPEVDPGLPP